jgi:hypothetical protein
MGAFMRRMCGVGLDQAAYQLSGVKPMAGRSEYSNWNEFVFEIARQMSAGKTLKELSDEYSGAKLRFSGVVQNARLTSEYSPGVKMDMPRIEAPLEGGRRLVIDYLFLKIDTRRKKEWEHVRSGMQISFEASIGKAGGVFDPVDVDEVPGDPDVVLSLAIDTAIPTGHSVSGVQDYISR